VLDLGGARISRFINFWTKKEEKRLVYKVVWGYLGTLGVKLVSTA
jgi:hypothetical protein